MRKISLLACLLLAVTFLAGLVVGQKAHPLRFSKYDRSGAYSGMDIMLLQANLAVTRSYVQAAPGVGLPNFYFDRDSRKIIGVSLVDMESLKNMESGDLKKELTNVVTSSWLALAPTLDEMKSPLDSDFIVEFRGFRRNQNERYYVFADWKNGVLSVH